MMIMLPKGIKVTSKKRNGKTISLGTWARAKFYEILKKEDFNYSTHPYRKTNDFKKVIDDGRSISQYMMKYIKKTLSMAKSDAYGSNWASYFIYGWKTANKIRHFTTSNTPFNQIEYQKLYHSLKKEEKELLIDKAIKNKANLMIELSKIVSIKRDTIDYDGTTKQKETLTSNEPIFIINSNTLKIKTYSDTKDEITESRKLQELTIEKNDEIRYRKSDFSS